MRTLLSLYILLYLCLFAKTAIAQRASVDFNLVKGVNGIALGKVDGITQDKSGYIWFADQTLRCLTRFDGYRMKTFRHDVLDSTSIGFSSFECIAADSSGNIWFPTDNGIDKFDTYTETTRHYHFDKNSACRGGSVEALLVDHSGAVWLGTSAGLYLINPETGQFTCYSHNENDPASLSCNRIRTLYEDHEGILWVGTGLPFDKLKEGGLNKFNRTTGKFTRYMHDDKDPYSLINDKVRAIFEDSRGVFWVGTQGDGLHIMDRKTGKFERLTYDPSRPDKLSRPPIQKGDGYDHITFITEDHAGALWIGTYSQGITRYDPQTKELTRYRAEKSGEKSFKDSTTWCAFVSRDGTLWISVEGINVYRVDPLQANFTKTFVDEYIWTFFEDSSHIVWGGAYANLLLRIDQTNRSKESIQKYLIDSTNDPAYFWVGGIYPLKHDILLIVTTKGLYEFNTKTKTFSKGLSVGRSNNKGSVDSAENKSIIPRGIAMAAENNGILYVGGIGLYVVNTRTGETRQIKKELADSTGFGIDTVTTLYKDGSGNIWIGGYEHAGLEFLDTKTSKFTHYLRGLTVWATYADSRGTIWVGSEQGLYRRKKDETSFTLFRSEQADLRTLSITGLTGDENDDIWGISPLGIFKINTLTGNVNFYGIKFGVRSLTSTLKMEAFRAHDGRIFLGYLGGFFSFDPKNVINRVPPQITLTGIKINSHPGTPGKDSLTDETIGQTSQVTLKHNQNFFSIDFAAIHFSDPENNVIQYKLDGYENTWRNVSEEKTAYYFNIPPEHYVFRIRAWSSYGVMSEKAVTVIVLPPWWQTWWFRAIEILFALVLIWGIIQYRSRNLKRRNVLLERKVTERTNALNNSLAELRTTQEQLIQSEKMASLGELTSGIAHEIKNPLNFISNFSEINLDLITDIEGEQHSGTTANEENNNAASLKTLRKNLEKINHHSKRIDSIVKGMLQHSRLGNVNKEPVNINTLCEESLKLAYHGYRAKEKTFNASFETKFDPELPPIMAIPQDLGRVMLNLFNNAFYAVNEKKKYTQAESEDEALQTELLYKPSVVVVTKKAGETVNITISDNGMGIPSSIIHKIFQPFYTTKPTGEGTGLGLSMSYDIIVKSHNGELKVKSKEGIGTDFEIVLPVK
ncbi:MAG: hypothetical protein JST09_16660 [Bacteroidetes bacterium]|nr:hypothetical protein [Bacteroidota bacterium]